MAREASSDVSDKNKESFMATTAIKLIQPTRALVLGAGGPVGRAWELGLASGLIAQGVTLRTADAIIGT